ncbi:MAG: IS1634 family transposase [Planctomycetota bacterium]
MKEVEIHTERIDDIPLLFHQQQRMGIAETIDEVVTVHGNRQGLSLGRMLSVWISYILSEADHRMSEVETWAAEQMESLSALLRGSVCEKDFTDDRLADGLRLLGNDEYWAEIEQRLSSRLIGVYDLKRSPVRLDSTTVAVYHDTEENTLFRHGHSKDHRPDLAQFKIMLATLDPLGMPVATLVVPGNESDDPLYIPAIREARPVVGQGGCLYVGDAKMGALGTRAFVQASGDYYLMPLARTGKVPELLQELLQPVWEKKQPVERIYAPDAEGLESKEKKRKIVALAYEATRLQQADVEEQTLSWQERVLVVYSPSLAQRARRGLAERLERAEKALLALTPPPGRGKRQWEDLDSLQQAAQAIVKKRRVQGLLQIGYHKEVDQRTIRKYGDRPARTEEQVRYVIEVDRDQAAIHAARRQMGWRLYVNNAPREILPLEQAIWAYRGASHIERNFGRFKGRPLGIRPLYVRREDHALGMVRVLSLALRVLTVVEHVVRQQLLNTGEALSGLYAGNPKRKTARPTTERLLRAFRGITLTIVQLPNQTIRHITPLSDLQQRILALLGLSGSIYENLALSVHPIPP